MIITATTTATTITTVLLSEDDWPDGEGLDDNGRDGGDLDDEEPMTVIEKQN